MTRRLVQVLPPVPEKDWQQTVESLAALRGWKWYHTRRSRGSVAGFPDLVLLRGSRMVVAELKRDGEVPAAEQRGWLDAFRAAGAETYVWTPADLREVAVVLR